MPLIECCQPYWGIVTQCGFPRHSLTGLLPALYWRATVPQWVASPLTGFVRAARLILGIATLHPVANIATCVLACPVMGYSHPMGNIDTDWLTASPMWGHSHPVEKTSPLAHWLTASLLLGIAPEFVPVANIATCLLAYRQPHIGIATRG